MDSSQQPHDSLLRALVFVGREHSISINPEQAIYGLPLKSGLLTPDLVEAACERVGLVAKTSKRSISKVHPAVLPVIVPLQNGMTFVMKRWIDKGTVAGQLFDGGVTEEDEVEISVEQLQSYYTGSVILVRRNSEFEDRSTLQGDRQKRKHWFWSTLWRFRGVYWRIAIATLLINMMALASSLFVMNVYDRVVPNEATDTLMALAIGVLIAYVMEFLLKTIRTCLADRAGRRVDVILGGDVFSKVLSSSFQNKPASAGTLAGQARSYESLREFFTSATIGAMVDLPFVLLFIGVVYILGGVAAMPLLIGVVIALTTSFLIQLPMKKAVDSGYRASNQRYALMVESVNALETVKATGSESHLQGRMEDCVKESASAEGKSRGISQMGSNLLGLYAHLVSTMTVVVAYFQVIDRNMSMGAMIACVILVGRAMQPLNMVASLCMRLQQSLRSFKGLDEMMKADDERSRKEKISPQHFRPSVEVENLKFGFGENPEGILKGLNLNIQPGEKVAILGKIGCGKTTLMRLMMALYDAREGALKISGLDTRQWSAPALRKHIGYLPQDSTLLYGTLGSNLISGCEGYITDDDIQNAVELAGLTSFIAALPDGLATPVSEGGKSLSGGQRQSLFLARALMRSPELLLLDEPTSSMDLVTEKQVLGNIHNYIQTDPNRTLIVATHRRSVLSIVDRVIVLDNGKVISDGPKDAVLAASASRSQQRRAEVSGDVALSN